MAQLYKTNDATFSITMIIVVLTLLVIWLTPPTPQHGISIDLPTINLPVSAPGALRSDAIIFSILRDGKVFFNNDQINLSQSAPKIWKQLGSAERRKIYIKVDALARYKSVADVLDGVRSTGIGGVSFLVEQRRQPI